MGNFFSLIFFALVIGFFIFRFIGWDSADNCGLDKESGKVIILGEIEQIPFFGGVAKDARSERLEQECGN